MLSHPRHFNFWILGVLVALIAFCCVAMAADAVEYKKNETGLYRDVFDQNMYYEGTGYLHLDRLYQRVFNKPARAKNVNVFDEVPDSDFFTNRHARKRLSLAELEKGYSENDGPDFSETVMVTKGKFEGLHPGFFIKDARGEYYILKFDPLDYFEMTTAAEVIASRFYYAIGYNVPQYTIAKFEQSKLKPAPDATMYDDTGFKKKLTAKRLEEYLVFLPQDPTVGGYRASASKILSGENKGNFSLNGRRKEDPNDPIEHRDRREIRALRIFASWLNNYDVRESNTLDMLVTENGRTFLKHYIFDFNASLGAGTDETKPPMYTHEYMMDYGESTKALVSLGLWEKPWQKRWREAGEKVTQSPAVGYFDNRRFNPKKFKTQLPYFAFKDITRADGFWAAKIIKSFTDEEIRAMVKAGEYTSSEDANLISNMLIERRDIIARYWFELSNPLDAIELHGNQLAFKDLAIGGGFESAQETAYQIDVLGVAGGKNHKLASLTIQEPMIAIQDGWFSGNDHLDLYIRTSRKNKLSPYVRVRVSRNSVLSIVHED